MSLLTSIVLGLIQGIAEFLPISSSGHLAIAQNLLGMDAAGNVPQFFDVLLHLGTLLAVFVAYWKDIKEMVVEFFHGIGDLAHHTTPSPVPPARRLVLMVILGTLPLVLVLPFDDKIEALSSNMTFVGGALLVTGLLLYASDRVRRGRKDERTMTVLDVLAVGLSQAVATAPGISRSGMTISMGCFTGLDRKFAVRFSFLLSIPAVLGANLLSLAKAAKAGIIWSEVPIYLAGVLVAAVAGYFCIRLLRLVAEKGKFGYFAYYCWVVGVAVIVLSILF
jgi:undecaprenyl-diphosphatase